MIESFPIGRIIQQRCSFRLKQFHRMDRMIIGKSLFISNSDFEVAISKLPFLVQHFLFVPFF